MVMTAVASISYLFGCVVLLYLVLAREPNVNSYMFSMMVVGTARIMINFTKVQALSASPNAAGAAARVLVDWVRCRVWRGQEPSLLPSPKPGDGENNMDGDELSHAAAKNVSAYRRAKSNPIY